MEPFTNVRQNVHGGKINTYLLGILYRSDAFDKIHREIILIFSYSAFEDICPWM